MPRHKMEIPVLFQFPGIGATCEGFLAAKATQVIQGKTVGRFIIKNGEKLQVLNGTVQLDDAMAQVMVGEYVTITFTGELPTQGGYSVRQFDVFVGEEDEPDGKE